MQKFLNCSFSINLFVKKLNFRSGPFLFSHSNDIKLLKKRFYSSAENADNKIRILGQQFQILDPSVWPFLMCLSLLGLVGTVVS